MNKNNTQYNPFISPSSNNSTDIRVIPYQRGKVRDDSFAETKEYQDHFIDPRVEGYDKDRIKLTPPELEKLKRSIDKEQTKEGVLPGAHRTFVNVDSRQRDILPINVYEPTYYTLPPYPLTFTPLSNVITVNFPNHPFVVNDRITLKNVVSKSLVLKNPLQVKKNSFYLRINQPNHGLSLSGLYNPSNPDEFQEVDYTGVLPPVFNPSDNIPDGINPNYILKLNLTLNFYIQLSNIVGNNYNGSFIGNIPINYLNKRQLVLLIFTKVGTMYVADQNNYLIQLEKKSTINYKDGVSYDTDVNGANTSTLSSNQVFVLYQMLYGIPLNLLNADYPITQNNNQGYFIVTSTTTDSFTFVTTGITVIDPNYSFYTSSDSFDPNFSLNIVGTNNGGGSQCIVQRIVVILPGYPKPNNYVFKLDRTYKNVAQINLISAEFPNSQRVFSLNCNKLYWQNLSDNSVIYTITLQPGNYSPKKLANALEELFSKTIRYGYTTEAAAGIFPTIITKATPTDTLLYDSNGYYKYHIVKVDINKKTDVVTFQSFNEILQTDNWQFTTVTIPNYVMSLTHKQSISVQDCKKITFPFIPTSHQMFVFFTINTPDPGVVITYPTVFNKLYRFVEYEPGSNVTYQVIFEGTVAVLVNFAAPINLIQSVNTTTLFTGVTWAVTGSADQYKITLSNHDLLTGYLIATDVIPFATIGSGTYSVAPGYVYIFEVVQIIDIDNFIIQFYAPGSSYRLIFDKYLINFSQPNTSCPSPPPVATAGLIQLIRTPPGPSPPDNDIIVVTIDPQNIKTINYVDPNDLVLDIPDNFINMTFANDLTVVSPPKILSPFNGSSGSLYVFFTPLTPSPAVMTLFPYAYNNLYQYTQTISTVPYTIQVKLITVTKLLVNFYNVFTFQQVINSVNTTTTLVNFSYNYVTGQVVLPFHNLSVGDLIITDQFADPSYVNFLFVYQISQIINNDIFQVTRYNIGTGPQFIYDNLMINFTNMSTIPYVSQYYELSPSIPDFSIIGIDIMPNGKMVMRVTQPNHNLVAGDSVTIRGSGPINSVPATSINRTFTITAVLNDNQYEVLFDQYTPLAYAVPRNLNIVYIRYPDIFRLLFNYNDTMGNLLSFSKVGQSTAITPFTHIIKNTDPYEVDYTYLSIGNEYVTELKKLSMTGDLYFYISSLELGHMANTDPVQNVFAKIRWNKQPGDICYDSFVVPTKKIYDIPLTTLSELTLAMYTPDGNLVDFSELNHAFTLEIIEIYNTPPEVNISARIDAQIVQTV